MLGDRPPPPYETEVSRFAIFFVPIRDGPQTFAGIHGFPTQAGPRRGSRARLATGATRPGSSRSRAIPRTAGPPTRPARATPRATSGSSRLLIRFKPPQDDRREHDYHGRRGQGHNPFHPRDPHSDTAVAHDPFALRIRRSCPAFRPALFADFDDLIGSLKSSMMVRESALRASILRDVSARNI